MSNEWKMFWNGDKILEATNSVVAKTSKKVAHNVVEDAKKLLKEKAETTTETGLLSQFSVVKSKFETGGYLVYSQGPKNWRRPYHASFMEMGTYKDEAKPYMRPAVAKNRRKANKTYQDDLDTWMRKG